MLQSFGAGQQNRIDYGGAERLANWSHRSPHRFQESRAGAIDRRPARSVVPLSPRPDHSPAAVARDDRDFGVARQPGLDRSGLAIREKVDDTSPFEIADDAPVALVSLPGPIIDADDAQR
jgi:hypothetical protein